MERAQTVQIKKDLKKKMVLLAGPRQAGKTFLAKEIAKDYPRAVYLNYDHVADRSVMKNHEWARTTDLLILDEIHKMPMWKNYLKGLYDTKPDTMMLLVTGSASLSLFRQAGDSMAGRYYLHHLLPLTPTELSQLDITLDNSRLMQFSGFPEPYLMSDLQEVERWRMQYLDDLIRIDVLELSTVAHIQHIKTLVQLLRERVGLPVSYTSLAEDIGVSANSIKKYCHILEMLYVIFRVTPFSKNIARALSKQPKFYFYDTGLVKAGEGAQFENYVALALLKQIQYQRDYFGVDGALHSIRTRDKKEIDFAKVKDGNIVEIIEVKLRDQAISSALKGFSRKYNLAAVRLVKECPYPIEKGGVLLTDIERYFMNWE